MAIDKDLILKLRNASHAGFADCKKALEENNNDLEESIKWLRKKGISKAIDKNSFKESKEGGTWVNKDSEGGVILELNSETDFTANSKEFVSLATDISETILKAKENDVEKARKLKMSNGDTVENNCLHLSSITGEKIVLTRSRYVPMSAGESIACYRHNNGKMSTLILFDKKLEDEKINGFAVHFAANNPKFISASQVDPEWVKSEREVISSLLAKENKPEQFRENIIEQRLKKLISQFSFEEQAYLYDSSKTVKEKLEELGVHVKEAIYFGLGDSH